MTFAVAAFFTAPHMFAMWRWIFVKGSALLELGGRLEYAPSTFLPTSLPFLAVDAAPPGRAALVVGAVTVVALLAVAQRFVATVLPMAYFIRAVAFILATAVIVFGVGTGSPTLNLTTYVRAMLQVSVGIWMLIPLLYGLTLFLLDIGWVRKAVLIAGAMAHLAVFIPLQHLVGTYVVHHLTLLTLPLLFVFGSVAPQVAMLIAFYAWGASWPERRT